MKKITFVAMCSLVLVSVLNARADDAAAPNSNTSAQAPKGVMAGEVVTASAKVEKVDLKNRELTVKGEQGKPFTVEVPQGVSRLDNVKPGDTVHLTFYESLALSLQGPGKTGTSETNVTKRAAGKLPGGMVAEQVTASVKVTKIDLDKNEIWVEGPNGKKNSIQVKDPQNQAALKNLKVGDRIRATYTEALATRITSGNAATS